MRAWEATIKGIIQGVTEERAQQLESELAQALHAVVSKAEYGAHYSQLGTPSFFGPVHTPQTPAAPPAPAPAATPQPAPAATLEQPAVSIAAPGLSALSPEQLAQLAEMAQKLGILPAPTPQEVPAT